MEQRPRIQQVAWGLLGAAAAAWFAIWMLFFPQYVPEYFAWDVHPRARRRSSAPGYIFRTVFFLNAAREGNWVRLRWIVYGNLAFTGDAAVRHLLASRRVPLESVRDAARAHLDRPVHLRAGRDAVPHPAGRHEGGGPGLRRAAPAGAEGIPRLHDRHPADERTARSSSTRSSLRTRWPWELNPLDARIVAAWFLGLVRLVRDDGLRGRTGTRSGGRAQLFILNGVVLFVAALVFRDEFLPGRGTVHGLCGRRSWSSRSS